MCVQTLVDATQRCAQADASAAPARINLKRAAQALRAQAHVGQAAAARRIVGADAAAVVGDVQPQHLAFEGQVHRHRMRPSMFAHVGQGLLSDVQDLQRGVRPDSALACSIKQEGTGFVQEDNTFLRIADLPRAQALVDAFNPEQEVLTADSPRVAGFLGKITPVLAQEIGSRLSTRIAGRCFKHGMGAAATRALVPLKKSIYSLIDLREISGRLQPALPGVPPPWKTPARASAICSG